MDLTIIPRRNPTQRDVVSNTLRDASDKPVVCYEIVDAPGIFTTESTSVKRVHEPVVRAKEDWQRPTTVMVRWGILRETTLNYVGGKERLPVRLKDYLKKADKNGKWCVALLDIRQTASILTYQCIAVGFVNSPPGTVLGINGASRTTPTCVYVSIFKHLLRAANGLVSSCTIKNPGSVSHRMIEENVLSPMHDASRDDVRSCTLLILVCTS